MKLMISHVHTSVSFTLFLLKDALGDVPSLRSLSRDLQIKTEGAITILEPGKGAHAVRISQTFVGNSADGCDDNDNGSNARIFFATFMDPDTLQEKCGIFQRNVSPCFQETVVAGCDLEANTATINLYVVDESFGKGMTTDNPKIGRCKAGKGDIIKRAIKVTKTFDCLPLTEDEKSTIRFNTCSASSDYCAEGSYCLFSTSYGYRCISGQPSPNCSCREDEECFYSNLTNGYVCRPFAQLGDPCTGAEVSEISRTCDPKSSFCYLRDSCYNSQSTGICVSFTSDVQCSSDDDCDSLTDFCDRLIERCKPKLKRGDCCDRYHTFDFGCGDGLTCALGRCQAECVGRNAKCQKNEYCAVENNDDTYYYDPPPYCLPFALKGDICGLYFPNDYRIECDPELYCFIPEGGDDYFKDDYIFGGTCWPLGKPCKVVSDCELTTEEWCDMTDGLCKPRLRRLYDCDPNIKKQCQEGLECAWDKFRWSCSSSDDV